jgi:hypothetical protein
MVKMSNRIRKVLGGILLAGALATPVFVSAGPQPQPAQEHERHPVIRDSSEKIEIARHDLQDYADRDFGGHRAKAVEHLDQALKELHMALEYDKH